MRRGNLFKPESWQPILGKMAEQKDKKGRSIHHTQLEKKGGKIGGKRTMSLKGYNENRKSIRARKSGKIGGLKKKDNCM